MPIKIIWTEEMLSTLTNEFATTFDLDLAKKLGISQVGENEYIIRFSPYRIDLMRIESNGHINITIGVY